MTERMKPARRIWRKGVRVREQHATRADRAAGQSISNDAVAHRGRGVVASTSRHGQLVRKPELARYVVPNRPGPVGALEDAGEPTDRDFERIQNLARPRALFQIEQERTRGIRRVGGPLPSQAQPDIVLWQE